MAGPTTESAVEAVELEAWADGELPNFQQTYNSLYNKLMRGGAQKQPISYTTSAGGVVRNPLRVPFIVQGGVNALQIPTSTPGSVPAIPRGVGATRDAFAIGPYTFLGVGEVANDAIWATEGAKRSKVRLMPQEMESSSESFMNQLEGLMNSDGSGTIDTIPATATVNNATGGGTIGTATYSSIVGLNLTAAFTDQQTVQVFPSVGGTSRGSFALSYTDPVTQTVYSSTALPAGTAVGDILVFAGASGAIGSSVFGLPYWHRNGSTGLMGGINRANYPGRLSTPTINVGGAVSPATAQRIQVLRMRAIGDKYKSDDAGAFWYLNPVQGYATSQDFFNKYVPAYKLEGDNVPDLARKNMSPTFLGEEALYSSTAVQSRADRVRPKDWIIGEAFGMRLHDFGDGMTIAPVPAQAGGFGTGFTYLNSKMYAWEQSFNLANKNPKAAFYLTSLSVPTV